MIDQPWPTEVRVVPGGQCLRVTFDDGASFELSAELLRVSSPSAEVKGHSPKDRKVVGGKRDAVIRAAQPVGNYAVKLSFDDGHDTGLYTWPYLHDLGTRREAIWAAYLSDLGALGLSRS